MYALNNHLSESEMVVFCWIKNFILASDFGILSVIGAVAKWLTQLFAKQIFVGSNPIRASIMAGPESSQYISRGEKWGYRARNVGVVFAVIGLVAPALLAPSIGLAISGEAFARISKKDVR